MLKFYVPEDIALCKLVVPSQSRSLTLAPFSISFFTVLMSLVRTAKIKLGVCFPYRLGSAPWSNSFSASLLDKSKRYLDFISTNILDSKNSPFGFAPFSRRSSPTAAELVSETIRWLKGVFNADSAVFQPSKIGN